MAEALVVASKVKKLVKEAGLPTSLLLHPRRYILVGLRQSLVRGLCAAPVG